MGLRREELTFTYTVACVHAKPPQAIQDWATLHLMYAHWRMPSGPESKLADRVVRYMGTAEVSRRAHLGVDQRKLAALTQLNYVAHPQAMAERRACSAG